MNANIYLTTSRFNYSNTCDLNVGWQLVLDFADMFAARARRPRLDVGSLRHTESLLDGVDN